jgi:5-methyltetrahydropteroyltriglutamate--homocysteine methyltransferase
MTPRTSPPYRADHVGSLLRPERLTHARDEHAAGRISADELREVEDEAIREVVRQQEDIGLQSATDGEFRRATWHMDFIDSLGGITHVEDRIKVEFHNEDGTISWEPTAMRVASRVTLEEPIFADHFRFLQSCVTSATPKLTIPSPSMVHFRGQRASIDDSVYPELDAFWDDVTTAYADEVRALGDLGCTYLQFDDTSLAYLNDPKQRDFVTRMGGDPVHLHEEYIGHINEALAGKPEGMAVTAHLCRGNFQSSWVAEGGYDYVAEALFNDLGVDGLFLEYDDARSGGFEPLRFVPKGKLVVLGLVTTKRGKLESKDELKRRIEEASQYVDVDQLCLSGQCGFSSTVEGNALTHEEQWAKLALIVETAREVWG